MRTEEEIPLTGLEHQIENVLIANDIKRADIQFRGGPTHSHQGDRYLRIGYWAQMPDKLLLYFRDFIEEVAEESDECGTLYHYTFKD